MADFPQQPKKSPVGHPTHPALVHFPITLFPFSLLFMALWFWFDRNQFYLQTAYWAYLLGTLLVIPVVLTGFRDMRHTQVDNEQGRKLLNMHMLLGGTIAGVSIVSSIYYLLNSPLQEPGLIPGFTFFTVLMTLFVFAQGAIGGLMVYSHHMGVTGHTVE